MIRSKRGLVAIGLTVLIVGLLVLFPARVALHWFAPAEFRVNGVEGTIWNGGAVEAAVNGVYFQKISWRMRPLSLLTGNVTYVVSGTPARGLFDAAVGISASGKITLSDVRAALPMSLFASAAGVRGLSGNASFSFDHVEIVDGIAVAADGVLQIANLVVPDFGRATLGGYKLEFDTQADGVIASVEDTDGVVDIAGSLEIKHDRSYAFVALVIATSATPKNVAQQLSYLPAANDRGHREIRLEGVL